MTIQLKTERLLLRPFAETDMDSYADMVADPEVMKFLGAGNTLDRGDAWDQIALMTGHWQIKGYGPFAVEERQTGAFVGRVGFYHPDDWPGMEIGWALARPHWGKGYATEAARAAVNWGFDSQPVDEIISCIKPTNTASIAVAKRIGESYRETIALRGNNPQIWSIRRNQWMTQRNAD